MSVFDRSCAVMAAPRRIFTSALTLAVASAAPQALAQEPEQQPAQSLPEITVEAAAEAGYKADESSSAKFTQPLLDTPRTVTVVPREVFEQQGATSLGDVLRNVSGISLAAGEGGVPAGDNLSLRGFSARTDLFIDGVRDFGGYSRDPFNLEAVEVVKGPASAYAGRGSTGGSVNLVTKKPALGDAASGALALGTDATRRVTIDVNEELEGLSEGAALRLNLLVHENEVAGRDEVENSRWGIAPSLSFGLGTPTRVTLSLFHLVQDNVPDYGHPYDATTGLPSDVDRDNWYGLRGVDHEDTETSIGGLLIEHDFDRDMTLRNQLNIGRTLRDSIATAPRSPNAAANTVDRTFKARDSEDTILSNQTTLSVKFATGAVRHTLVSGLELAREQSENRSSTAPGSTLNPANLSDPNPNDPLNGSFTPNDLNKADADSIGVYVFDTVELSERWEVSGGLRWDRFAVDYSSRDIASGALVNEFDRADTMLSWNLGAVYKPRPNGSVYAGYGTSFNPSAEGLTLRESNAGLEPEKSRTLELGTKWEWLGGALGLNAAVFRTEKTNARTDDPVDPTFDVLEGEQRVDGLELGLVGQLSRDWNVFAGYTLLDSEVVESNVAEEVGNELPNVPENTFKLWTSYRVSRNIEVGAGGQYVDSRFSRANGATRAQVPDYWLFDAMAAYTINKTVQLRLNLYNLADEEYYANVGGGHAVPGAGRSALLTTSFKF